MITSVDEMKDKEFLRMWIENEARRDDAEGDGGGDDLFGGLFGMFKQQWRYESQKVDRYGAALKGTDHDEDQTQKIIYCPQS